MELDRHALDRWITREDDEPADAEYTSCDGSTRCSCPDCCADAAQAEFDDYVRRERL
jgi:hypothetical protein